MGRWSYITIAGRQGRALTIISAYRVTKSSISEAGANTSFFQQYHFLRLSGHQHPDPRKTFLRDLGAIIRSLRQNPLHHIILLLDANESTSSPNDFTKWISSHHLNDPYTLRHGFDEPATHSRGSKRIDYILVSDGVLDHVTATGILPFDEIVTSDHRAFYMDVNLEALLLTTPQFLQAGTPRGIHSHNPKTLQYLARNLEQFLLSSNIEARLNSLVHSTAPPDMTIVNTIDSELTQALLHFDSECQRFSNVPWSPVLRDAHHTVKYWTLWLTEYKTHSDRSDQRLALDLGILDPEFPKLRTVIHRLRHASRQYRQVLVEADQHRIEHLKNLQSLHLLSDDPAAAKAVKGILQHEKQSNIFSHLRALQGKNKSGALSSISYPNPTSPDDWLTTDDPETMEELLLARNTAHFSQADRTPFATAPLKTIFGPNGTNDASQQLLNKTFDIDSLPVDAATKSILHSIRRICPADTICSAIDSKDMESGYRVWRESTTTSPTGIHLGIDKAIIKLPRPEDQPSLASRFFAIRADLILLCLRTGEPLDRWTHVNNMMIEKKPGVNRIDKLRVIHLMESDFNLLNGIFWSRRAIPAAELSQQLGFVNGAYRKNFQATDPLFQKQTCYNISRLTRTDAVYFDCDAKSNFDRIVLLLSSLIAQQYGMPKSYCDLYLTSMRRVRYHIKTRLGISSRFYTTDDITSMHGPGQGSRSGASIWSLTSCQLLHLMSSQAHGMTFHNPTRTTTFAQPMIAFADDKTGITNDFLHNLAGRTKPKFLLRHAQRDAELWNSLLYSTGGKLEYKKCFVYAALWIFDGEGVPMFKPRNENNFPFILRDIESDVPISILHKQCHAPHKTLGAMTNPAAVYSAEEDRLLRKSKEYARVAACCHISIDTAWTFHRSIFIPGMTSTGPTSALFLKDCIKIQAPLVSALLPKMSIPATFPRELVFGPTHLMGLGLQHLDISTNTWKVHFVLSHLRTPRPTGNLIVIYLQLAQLVSGLSQPLLETPTEAIPHLREEKWLCSLLEFLRKSRAGIYSPHFLPKSPHRTNDLYLMDYALSLSLSPRDICQINRCRLFLRVETLSDICNATGTKIAQNTHELHHCFRSRILWPRQTRPGKQHLRTWRRFIQHFCRSPDTLTLRQPLGSWTHPTPRLWNNYVSLSQGIGYTRHHNELWTTTILTRSLRRGGWTSDCLLYTSPSPRDS